MVRLRFYQDTVLTVLLVLMVLMVSPYFFNAPSSHSHPLKVTRGSEIPADPKDGGTFLTSR